jgi:hypothetical protein
MEGRNKQTRMDKNGTRINEERSMDNYEQIKQ